MDGRRGEKKALRGDGRKGKGREGRGACNLGVYLCRAQKETDSTIDNFKVPPRK